MDGPHLQSLLIENFRSINRKIEMRVDAPVVLLHGLNGSGKTSILLAMELALTGTIASLARGDPGYQSQLLHHGSAEGQIVLEVGGVNDITSPISVKLNSAGLSTLGQFSGQDARFFSERCVLAQSLLTELLTIYQESDSGVGSPLSRFVHELLGLDRLDALELGLQPAKDLRNARRLAPTYEDAEEERDKVNREIGNTEAQLTEIEALIEHGEAALKNALSVLAIEMPLDVADLAALDRILSSDNEETALLKLAGTERDLAVLQRELDRQIQISFSRTRLEFEAAHARSQRQLAIWREENSPKLDEVLAVIRQLFPSIELPNEDPAEAVSAATAMVETDLARLTLIAERENADRKRRIEIEDASVRARLRITALDTEIGSIASQAGGLSAALSELLPHIHSDDCPVCGRNYGEVSTEPLTTRVAARAIELSDQAERLNALSRERAILVGQQSALTREHDLLIARGIGEKPNLELQDRTAKLRNAASLLKSLDVSAAKGSELIALELSARRDLARLPGQNSERELRHSIVELARSLSADTPGSSESLSVALGRLNTHVLNQKSRLSGQLEARRIAFRELRELNARRQMAITLREAIQEKRNAKKKVVAALRAADKIRSNARQIISYASITRAAIISRVFNDRLNRLWRDLFVRLAPSEDFVPAFHIPTNPQSHLVPTLETRHRSGGTGGTPGAMLSAGNLNTAALTLFLSLHLSVKPRLPWLILDDPVQSMDDVHIAHFAALLRTLSKEHYRQVIIAVHDRPLYEYLALELSPAFQGDELITIEISTSAERRTRLSTTRRSFEPDTTLKPVAA